jgi:putative intracellular protease/amidase
MPSRAAPGRAVGTDAGHEVVVIGNQRGALITSRKSEDLDAFCRAVEAKLD